MDGPNVAFCDFVRISATHIQCAVCSRKVKHAGDVSRIVANCFTLNVPCSHRGKDVLRQVPCGCGERGKMRDVYLCNLHGVDCAVRRAKAGDGLRACSTCEDRLELQG